MTKPTVEQMIEVLRAIGKNIAINGHEFCIYAADRLAQQSVQPTAAVPNLDEYYLQDSRTYVGNSMLWWGKGRAGYYCDLKDAHVFTKDEAYEQHRSRSSDIPWPKFYIDALASRHADVQRVKREQADAAIERAKAGA